MTARSLENRPHGLYLVIRQNKRAHDLGSRNDIPAFAQNDATSTRGSLLLSHTHTLDLISQHMGRGISWQRLSWGLEPAEMMTDMRSGGFHQLGMPLLIRDAARDSF